MRQQRTDRSQGWVKVLAVLQTEHTLRGKIQGWIPTWTIIGAPPRCSSVIKHCAAAYHHGSSDKHVKLEGHPCSGDIFTQNDSTNPIISSG